MKRLLPVLFLVGCGADSASVVTGYEVIRNPKMIEEGARFYGGSFSERSKNFRTDNDDGWISTKDQAGEEANNAREYLYTRGIQEVRHGDNSSGPAGSDGAMGESGGQGPRGDGGPMGASGRDGETGATGASGPQGETGATGETGPAGEAGDDFNGDARLADLEARVAALEAMDVAFETALALQEVASEMADQELADQILSLTDYVTAQIQRLDRRISRVNRRSVRAIRDLSNYVDYELAQLAMAVAGNSIDLAQIASSINSIEEALDTLESAEDLDTTCSVDLRGLPGPWVEVTITCGDDVTKFEALED